MSDEVHRLRVAVSDVFDWSVTNVRDTLSPASWLEVRNSFGHIKQVLDEHNSAGLKRRYKLLEVLNVLESEE